MNDPYVPKGWTDLLEALYPKERLPDLLRFRSTEGYRGLPDKTFDLQTSLLRVATRAEVAETIEGAMLRSFRKYAHAEAAAGDTIWNWLALAQHHGLPTRLMDWSWSPLVALHFATDRVDLFDKDGVVWCLDADKTHALLPDNMRDLLRTEHSYTFSVEMLHNLASSLAVLDKGDEKFVLFLEPPSLDARIINQYAAFTLMNSCSARLDEWLEDHPDLYRRILIPKELKWEIRDKLDQANVSERMLFPGLDGLTRWLTRYYTPKHLADADLQAAASAGSGHRGP